MTINLQQWEPWLVPYLPEKGRTFIDVGANRGIWTQSLANRFARVVAIEPNREAYQQLTSALPSNTKALNVAAWSNIGKLRLAIYGDTTHTSPVFQSQGIGTGPQTGAIEVDCIMVDSLKVPDCDFIKIDTEGGEANVVYGAMETLKATHPQLIIEVHNAANRVWLEITLKELGYQVTVIHHPHYPVGNQYYEMHLWLNAVSASLIDL